MWKSYKQVTAEHV